MRNWSTYSFIHSIKCNRLYSKRVNLVYVHSNLCLLLHKHNYKKGDTKLWDIEPKHTNLDASTSYLIAYEDSEIQHCNVPFLALCFLVADNLFLESHRLLGGTFRVSSFLEVSRQLLRRLL